MSDDSGSDDYDYNYSDDGMSDYAGDSYSEYSDQEDMSIQSQTSKKVYTEIFQQDQNFLNFMTDLAKKYQDVLGLSEDLILILLNQCHWDGEKLTEIYFENSEKILKENHLIDENTDHLLNLTESPNLPINPEKGTCFVCFEDSTDLVSNDLCDHYYCKTCYQQHVSAKLSENASFLINCINPECQIILQPKFIENLANTESDSKILAKYQTALINSIVESNPQLSWCSSNKCEAIFYVSDRNYAKTLKNYFLNTDIYKQIIENETVLKIKAELEETELGLSSSSSSSKSKQNNTPKSQKPAHNCAKKLQIVNNLFNPETLKIECEICQQNSCFNCSKHWHEPVTCEYLAKWEKKANDDSETTLWIRVNTKECPKCKTKIEKNQGCNHVTCKSVNCSYEFCWICMEEWKLHGNSWFKCDKIALKKLNNKEEFDKQENELERSKALLDKYLECYSRFEAHRSSLKFEMKQQGTIKRKQDFLQHVLNISFMETSILDKAVRTLCDCRRIVMYCYVFRYYLVKNQEIDEMNDVIFSDNLDDLHYQVEKLSGLLDNWNPDSHFIGTDPNLGLEQACQQSSPGENSQSRNNIWVHRNAVDRANARDLVRWRRRMLKAQKPPGKPYAVNSYEHQIIENAQQFVVLTDEEKQQLMEDFRTVKKKILDQENYRSVF